MAVGGAIPGPYLRRWAPYDETRVKPRDSSQLEIK